MKVAIAGFGMEGRSSYDYFLASSHEVVIIDENPNVEIPGGAQSILGDTSFSDLNDFDLIVRSSGLNPKKLIEFNPGIETKVTTQLNEFLKVCPSKNIIGVTGTKGKGTTSTLVAKILESSGKPVVLGGNIGVAMLSLLGSITPDTYVVLELSSFQLSDLNEPSPSTAVCLMMSPEHLDWHGDLESYIVAKSNLFSHQDSSGTAVFYADNEISKRIAGYSPGRKIPYFSSPGAFIDNDNIVIDDQVICSTGELKLLGAHNWQNVCAAVTAAWQIDKNIEAIRSVLTSFSGLEHRLELVKEVDQVRYYNDSYASQFKASEAAIQAVNGKKVMIVGGFDRMIDLNEFSVFIKGSEDSLRTLLIIGASGQRLANSLNEQGFTNYVLADNLTTMPEIVSKARSLSESGDAVVLSPGFASFDMFKNFEDRGLQFKAAVNNL